MPAICTATVSPNNCGHRTHTVTWLGVTYTVQRNPEPLTEAERQQFLEYTARILEHDTGVTASAFLNRILHGDEATNVKTYSFFGPGVALTKTNIGTAYVNIPVGLNGERILVDFTGCTQFRAFLNANLVATGPFQVRIVRDGDNAVLYESPSIPLTGERELDSDWTAIPAGFDGLTLLRMQMKSGTGSDDPICRRGGLLVR